MNTDQFSTICLGTTSLILSGGTDMYLPPPQPKKTEDYPTSPEHLLWMLEQAPIFHTEGKQDKAERWLGFVQGVIATRGWATLNDLKRTNSWFDLPKETT